MEDRSSRRVRTLVTRMVHRGLSANKVARALISMMVGSRDKLQSETGYIDARPHPPDRRNLLQRTAGPYIGSRATKLILSTRSPLVPPIADIRADVVFRRFGPADDIPEIFLGRSAGLDSSRLAFGRSRMRGGLDTGFDLSDRSHDLAAETL